MDIFFPPELFYINTRHHWRTFQNNPNSYTNFTAAVLMGTVDSQMTNAVITQGTEALWR